MDEHDGHDPEQGIPRRSGLADALATDHRMAGFTRAERRRLVFLRWLYAHGRLSEFFEARVQDGAGSTAR